MLERQACAASDTSPSVAAIPEAISQLHHSPIIVMVPAAPSLSIGPQSVSASFDQPPQQR